jgi:hypothetical protein
MSPIVCLKSSGKAVVGVLTTLASCSGRYDFWQAIQVTIEREMIGHRSILFSLVASSSPCAVCASGKGYLGEIWSSNSAIVRKVVGSRSPSFALRRIVSAIDFIWLELIGCGKVATAPSMRVKPGTNLTFPSRALL